MISPMIELDYYEVVIGGVTHTLKLSAEDAKRHPGAKQGDGPAKSQAMTLAEQVANAPASEVTVEQVVTSPQTLAGDSGDSGDSGTSENPPEGSEVSETPAEASEQPVPAKPRAATKK